MISQTIISQKILDHLNGKLSQEELVTWAENAFVELTESDTDIANEEMLLDTLAYIGAGDSPGFSLSWVVLSGFLERMGTKVRVIAEAV
ncbi:MAG: hypothetical protein LCI00_33835 [Chloroflexi bacterium]|nr:hypothetical protein [Chloroflexota bacterium]MCC6894327.1 hypothetical protein [Anaerolineae bacterium]